MEADQYTVESAIPKEDRKEEDIKRIA